MSVTMNLEEISARVVALEKKVEELARKQDGRARQQTEPSSNGRSRFAYIIKVGDKQVWRGLALEPKLIEITRANPDKIVTVSWDYSPDILAI